MSRENNGNPKQKLNLTKVLLMVGFIPLVAAGVLICVISGITTATNLTEDVYDKLFVASDGLRKYYQYELEAGNEMPYEHDYVDMLKGDDIEMTLFMGDTRFMTSDLNDKGERNEGTQMDPKIWAELQKGNDYYADGVIIGGKPYYVYYRPLYDADGSVAGSAWAGEPSAKVKASIRQAVLTTVIAVILAIVVFGAIILFVSKKIISTINEVVAGVRKLADGDLTEMEYPKSHIQEIADIGADVYRLNNTLRDIVSGILGNTRDLDMNMSDVASGVDSCNDTSNGIVKAVDDLSKGSMEMAESVQNTNANMITIGDGVDEIKTLSDSATGYAKEAEEESQKAQAALNALIKANTETVEVSNNVVDGINSSSAAIEKISSAASVIEEIASQTNLLSLNASIEAARAGEAGRGFAVVASEISSLAQQSDQSSKEIKEVVNEIIATSNKNVEYAGQIQNAVNNEGNVLTKVNDSFSVMNSKLGDTVEAINTIAVRAEDLDAAKAQVIDDVTSLSSISQQNAASCEETNASMVEMGETISNIKLESDKTMSVAGALKDAMSAFTI
ncbi:MAG: cache domain-containing protein [Lachnospiraceae bacterium]|nr:cache domain-containing protein [Lachnospiraceae bacterium]